MSLRRFLVVLLIAACGVVPIIVGASCPPPANPPILAVVSPSTTQTIAVPPCIEGFVCVNLANNASVPCQMALYVHDGFDPNNQFQLPPDFACCTNPNSQTACICPCPGRDTGECQLNRLQIFDPTNLYPIANSQFVPLQTGQSILQRIRCGDVKTLGAATAQATGDVIAEPEDSVGPVYRDEPGGVQCGQTVQFLTTDLNQQGTQTGGTSLATLIIRTQFSR